MHCLAPTLRSCFHCVVRPWISSPTVLTRRPYSLSSQGPNAEVDVIDDLQPESMGGEGNEKPRSYRQFMDKLGYQYRFARPQNWLGRNVVLILSLLFNVESFPPFSHSP